LENNIHELWERKLRSVLEDEVQEVDETNNINSNLLQDSGSLRLEQETLELWLGDFAVFICVDFRVLQH
jgi:hypothetical protein